MELFFLGSGSSFCDTKRNFHNNAMVKHKGKTLLIDAGNTLQCALDFHDVQVNEIDAIFVTHLHGDHIGGLEYIGFKRYFQSFPFGSNKPKLFVHPYLIDDLSTCLMMTMGKTTVGNMTIHDYFEVIVDDADRIMSEFMGLEIEQILVNHVSSQDAVALKIGSQDGKYSMVFTGDINKPIHLKQLSPNVVIFHDCEFAEYQGGVHAQYHELVKLPDIIKNKIILMHSNKIVDKELVKMVRADGFLDVANRGQNYKLWS